MTGWIIFFLAFTELALRFFLISVPSHSAIQNGGGVEVYGYEGYGMIYYLPNAEVASPYDTGKNNIVVLGDSFTQARHVMYWDNFTSVAESTLYDRGLSGCNLRNLGNKNQDLADYIGMGASVMEAYSPAAVVIQISLSDIADSFDSKEGFYFQPAQNGEMILTQGENYESLLKLADPNNSRGSFLSMFDFSSSSIGYALTIQNSNLFSKSNAVVEADIARPADIKPSGKLSKKQLVQINFLADLMDATYNKLPIIFIFIPEPTDDYSYEKNKQLLQVIGLLESRPNWKVIYPYNEFSSALLNGAEPHGFGNTLPMQGHINTVGHQIIGEALANELAKISVCGK
jgi:lysophospholipase L1-like esterase